MKIHLNRGLSTIIDAEDLDKISHVGWFAHYDKTIHGNYVHGNINGKTVVLARLIMDCPTGLQVDHINRDTLDNRKANLRILTPTQNLKNKGLYRNNRLGIKGISMHGNRYRARIRIDGKLHESCGHENLQEAISAYKSMEKLITL